MGIGDDDSDKEGGNVEHIEVTDIKLISVKTPISIFSYLFS